MEISHRKSSISYTEIKEFCFLESSVLGFKYSIKKKRLFKLQRNLRHIGSP